MNTKTLSLLGLTALLSVIPAVSAEANLAAADSLATTHQSAAVCYLIALDSPNAVAIDANTPQFTFVQADGRLVAFRFACGPGVILPAGCTLTYAVALAGATLWYVNYVYVTPVSPANEVSGAATFGGMAAGATLTYVSCI